MTQRIFTGKEFKTGNAVPIISIVFWVLLTIFLFSSCSSGKNGGQSYIGRVYHNTSAHYNGYYYAKLKMTETEQQMHYGRKDDYTKLLPIYDIGNVEDPAAGGEMDSVIKRLTIVVKLHPKSKWADDCYFNIGKAYYYKKNYEAALATFQFVSSEFKDKNPSTSSASKKKKKRSGKPMTKAQREAAQAKEEAKAESGKGSAFDFLKHKPIRNIDLLWMIRSYANLKNYNDAQAIIAYLEEGNKFPPELSEDLALTKAYVSIQQKQFDKAIEPMKAAINTTKDKKSETRYTYILAQLYQLNGSFKNATQEFTQVTKLRPSYEMDFNARISMGKIFVQSGTGSYKETMALLEDMSHNERYEEFNDVIYYYMALTNLRQDKNEEAVKNLETSIKKSFTNANQKGLSFLKLGELSFGEQDYLTAQPSYDSAVVFLDAKFDTLDRVKEIKEVLDNLADQTQLILIEDSLQKLAKMSEKDRNRVIDKALSAQEIKKQYEAQDTLLSLQTQQVQELPGNQASTSGSWYFYNTSMKATGYNDFIKKWGNRPLEDNWRRSNKKSNDNAIVDAGEISEENAVAAKTDNSNPEDAERKKMLDNIPLTQDKLATSNKNVFSAYYAIGTIYKSDLVNIPKAIETFEKLATRFPEDERITSVYYNLYLLYLQTGNMAKAETYKQQILQQHPASAFAMVLSDPDYLRKTEEKKNELNNYYASTYDYFVEEKYSDVVKRVHAADSLFKPNPLQPKFELLEAMVTGKFLGREQYIAALEAIVKKYPAGEVHDKAVEILLALGVQVATTTSAKALEPMKKNAGASPYQMHPANPHYFVVVFNTISPKTKGIADSLADFNKAEHALDNYKVSPQLLDTKTQMIVVKQMKNRDAAMIYYNQLSESETLFESVEDIGYEIFVIDDKNFPLFYQRKNVAEYVNFFYKNYEGGDDEEEAGEEVGDDGGEDDGE